MGVVAADLDDDGWVDVFQTNDSSPNFLFRNLGDGRMRDVALEAEVAYSPSGQVTGAMATDAEDVDGDGRLDLIVTNFNSQGTFLHRNQGGMRFLDRGHKLGLSMPTFTVSSFGARFLDYDNDGLVDLFVAAGHPFAPVSKVWPQVRYAEPPFLFENDGEGFTNVAPERGEALREPLRGTRGGHRGLRQRRRPRRAAPHREPAPAPAPQRRREPPSLAGGGAGRARRAPATPSGRR